MKNNMILSVISLLLLVITPAVVAKLYYDSALNNKWGQTGDIRCPKLCDKLGEKWNGYWLRTYGGGNDIEPGACGCGERNTYEELHDK